MKEQKPVENNEDFIKDINSTKTQEVVRLSRRLFQAHRLLRKITNASLRLMIFSKILMDPEGREALRDPATRRFFFDREKRTGLLEDSILNPDIYHPNRETTSLELNSAPAGRWAGYDFNRGQEFSLGKHTYERSKVDGRLTVFKLDDIQDNSADTYTPTALFNLFDVIQMLTISFPTIDEALEEGYLKETNYKDAYSKVGLYDKYKLYLFGIGIADKPIYIVTPKGNAVVMLVRDFGRKSEKPKVVPEFKPVLES